jgi:hypothetical protein
MAQVVANDMLSYGESAKLKLAAAWIADRARSPRDVPSLLVTMGRVGGASALHFAARHDNPVAIGLLIQAGAVLQAGTGYEEPGEATPRGWACAAGAEGAAKPCSNHGHDETMLPLLFGTKG